MANLVGYNKAVVGAPGSIHTTARNPVGTRAFDDAGNEYIYLKGVASTVLGSWVYYDELFLTVLTVANSLGGIAIAYGATVASTWGWYGIFGAHYGLCLTSYAVGRSARDTTSGLALFQLNYPFALNEVHN